MFSEILQQTRRKKKKKKKEKKKEEKERENKCIWVIERESKRLCFCMFTHCERQHKSDFQERGWGKA